MNDLNSHIEIAKQHEPADHVPVVDRTEQVAVGLEMAQRMANPPEPELVMPQPKVFPVPN